jgi:small subunit ribosomal protein S19
MSRSSWKLRYLPEAIIRLKKLTAHKVPEIWSRSAVIPSFLVDRTVKIHTGKEFKNLKVTEDKVGYKFGEFIFTRKSYIYKGKKKIIKRKK